MPLDSTTYHGIDQDEVLAILRGAKELIRNRGWCQGSAQGDNGALCLFSAIREAGNLVVSGDFERLGIPWPAVWQDQPGRTVEDVYAWLDEQIALREVA